MFTISTFDPLKADDIAWAAYFNFCNVAAGNYLPKNEFINWVKERTQKNNREFRLIFEDDKPVIAITSFSKKGNDGEEMYFISMDCTIKACPDELKQQIAGAILALAEAGKFKSFRISTAQPLLQHLLIEFNAVLVNTTNYYQLSRGQLNRDRLNAWLLNDDIASGAVRLTVFDFVPEHLYKEYAALLTELMNDIVRADSHERFEETAKGAKQKMERFKKTGVKMITLFLCDYEQQLIGMSLLLYYPNKTFANQEMTGVKKQYRGKKLACYLKAIMTKTAFSRLPEITGIHTDCYAANTAMIHINEQIGYLPTEKSLQFDVEMRNIADFVAAG